MDNESSLLLRKRLLEYVDDNIVLEPPCYSNIIYDIFESYIHTGYSKSFEEPIEKLQNDFAYIELEDLKKLLEYLKNANNYLDLVCCAFAGIYQSVIIPKTNEVQEDTELVVKACQNRYPWIKSECVKAILHGICWQCNR